MRVGTWLVVAVLGWSLTASAEEPHKIRAPKQSRESKTVKSSVPVREPKTDDALNHQLRAAEQNTTKMGLVKGPARPHHTRVNLAATKEKPNPPIHFSSAASGGHAMSATQGSNPYKGRLREKRQH